MMCDFFGGFFFLGYSMMKSLCFCRHVLAEFDFLVSFSKALVPACVKVGCLHTMFTNDVCPWRLPGELGRCGLCGSVPVSESRVMSVSCHQPAVSTSSLSPLQQTTSPRVLTIHDKTQLQTSNNHHHSTVEPSTSLNHAAIQSLNLTIHIYPDRHQMYSLLQDACELSWPSLPRPHGCFFSHVFSSVTQL